MVIRVFTSVSAKFTDPNHGTGLLTAAWSSDDTRVIIVAVFILLSPVSLIPAFIVTQLHLKQRNVHDSNILYLSDLARGEQAV